MSARVCVCVYVRVCVYIGGWGGGVKSPVLGLLARLSIFKNILITNEVATLSKLCPTDKGGIMSCLK